MMSVDPLASPYSSQGRLYRIGVVAELTGVGAPTLRAWERRYGVPKPARTVVSYRLYDEGAVADVCAMRDLCAGGMAAAEAARAVRKVRKGSVGPVALAPRAEGSTGEVSALSRETLLRAVRDYDAPAIDEELYRLAGWAAPVRAFEQVLGPTSRLIGEMWSRGELGVAEEHLYSERVGFAVRAWLRALQPPPSRPKALLACVEGEEHTLALLGAALKFARQGFHTVVLGASVPSSALGEAAARLRPRITGLSVSLRPARRSGFFRPTRGCWRARIGSSGAPLARCSRVTSSP